MALIRRRAAPEAGAARYEVADAPDAFVFVADGAEIPASGDVVVSLARFEQEGDALRARGGRVGVRVPGSGSVESLAAHVAWLALVEIEFPKFGEGRGYSLARLLRERHGYTGELRAVGNVLRDQLLYMHRCGFDAFALDPSFGAGGRDPASVLAAFEEQHTLYQSAGDEQLPLWKRVSRA